MTAASYWSLLAPAIEMAENSGYYGKDGQWAFVPVAVGFVLGAVFVYSTDILLPYLVRFTNFYVTLDSNIEINTFPGNFYVFLVDTFLKLSGHFSCSPFWPKRQILRSRHAVLHRKFSNGDPH